MNAVIEKETQGKSGFETKPLTKEERIKLGVDRYYAPYMVNKQSVLRSRRAYWIVKRMFDILASLLALIVLSPVILVCLLAVVIEDPAGSPVFAQARVGKGGKIFKFYKIRSMCVDAEEKLAELMELNEVSDGKAFKIKDDPRITKVGKVLRNTSLDELLQLVNILKGDMSVVGPRPPLPNEVENYTEYEKQRMTVTPGLTCFWQVYPGRHELPFEDWCALDVKYIAERSWWTDIKLIFATVMLILKGAHD